ncbi:MAG: acyl-CoA dehydrogenase family protein [Cryobacterium sp.]|nr:acyl-CoA dehydrogenase family protein [Cryobacterium sp.]
MYAISEDQKALVEMVRQFAADELALRAAEWDENSHFPLEVLAHAGELGMGAMYCSEELGGSGLSRSDAVLIFEELAKADPTIASYISIHNMVAWMIDHYGNDTQRQEWIPKLATMEHLGSYCLTEPGAGSDAAALSTTAVREGDEYVINGTKQFISGAGSSAIYVVMARTGGKGSHGISAILVPDGTKGLSFGLLEKKMGWHAQPTRQVIFEDVRVPAANLLATEGEGFAIALNGLNGGRLNIGACSIGAGQAALEQTVEHVKSRQAFGGPLVDQQSVLFTLAEMDTQLETARTLLSRAAAALDAGDDDKIRLCAMAKRVATEAGYWVVDSAIQLHGGYGYLREYGLERLARDLRVHRILEGANEVMQLIVGRSLLSK